MDRFHALTKEEIEQVLDAPALITYLIGGADGNLDKKEEERSKRAIAYRSIKGDPLLFDYFQELEKDFDLRLERVIKTYTGDTPTRTKAITEELTRLNPVLSKLEKIYAQSLVKSWRNMAEAIATSSGAFFGFFGVSSAEKDLVGLDMFNQDV